MGDSQENTMNTKGEKEPKGKPKFIKKHHPSFAYNRAFYRRWKMEVRARYHVISVDSDGLLLVLTRRGKEMNVNDLPMTFRRLI